MQCDGKHPICANCEKRAQECTFLALVPSSRLSLTSTPSASSPTATTTSSPHSPVTPSPPSSTHPSIAPKTPYQIQVFRHTHDPTPKREAAVELEVLPVSSIPASIRCIDLWKDTRETLTPRLRYLLYHYEYATSLTLANDDPAKTAWQSSVPELASRHQFLVHHVLAVASLHLGRLQEGTPEKGASTAIAAALMNRALSRFRPEIANVNADNAAALFASATLTAVYCFRTSTMDIDEIRASVPADTVIPPSDVVDRMLHCILRTFWGLRGPWAVLAPGWHYVMRGEMAPVAQRKWWPSPKDRLPATLRAMEEDGRLSEIENLWIHPDRAYEPHFRHLSDALLYLRESFALVSQLTLPENEFPPTTSISYSVDDTTVGYLKDRGAMFLWATLISREFLQLVEQKNRDALVLIAHYAVLPGRVRNVWWLEGLGADMAATVAMALGRENWHLIEWPISVLGIDLESLFGARDDSLVRRPVHMSLEIM